MPRPLKSLIYALKKASLLVCIVLLIANNLFSQATISGPTCAILGTQYTYSMSNWAHSPSVTMTWLVTGGQISKDNGATWVINGQVSQTPLPNVLVKWTSNPTHTLQLTTTQSGATSGSLSVSITSALAGGTISNPTQTIAYNTVPTTISCSAATGGGCTPSYSYQWLQSSDGSTFTNISGATAQNLSFTVPLAQTMYYKRFVTETSSSTTAYSTNTATVVVNPPPLVPGPTSPTFQLTNSYTSAPITMTSGAASLASCTSGNCFTYQWQQSTDHVNWSNISNATELAYNPGQGQPTVTAYYRLQVQGGGQTAYSTVDTIQSQNCVIGGPAECWLGQTTTYYYYYGPTSSYVWNPTVGARIIGSYTGVATLNVQWVQAGQQTVNLSYPGTNLALSVYVKNYAFYPGQIRVPQQVVEQTSQISLYPTPAIGGSCLGSYANQWQQSTDSINYSNILGQTGNTISIVPTQNVYYRLQVTCGSSVAYTDTSHITLYPYFNPGTITSGNTDSVAWNTAPNLITGALPIGGVDTCYKYQWYSSTDGTNFTAVSSGGQGVNYQPGPLAQATYYYRAATCGPTTRNSNTILENVKKVLFDPGTVSPYTLVASPGSSPSLTGTAATGGTSASYNYQWQQSYDEIGWQNCASGNTQNYTPTGLNRTTYFRRIVTNSAQSGISVAGSYYNEIKVKITPLVPGSPTSTNVPITAYSYPGVTPMMVNYVRGWNLEKPGVTTLSAAKGLTNVYDYQQSTTYLDDLGREVQTVAKQATPNGNDLITTGNYDILGREVQKYLPYTDSLNNGNFRANAPTKQGGIYNTMYGGQEGYFYANTVYDASPMNRVVKQTAPGNSWTGNAIGKRMDYVFNSTLDSVRVWTVGNNIADTPVSIGVYAPGTLTLVVTTDEQENKVMEYKDMEGKTILKKVQLSDTLNNGYAGWLCTYYMYDVFNHLRYVLSPNAVNYASANNWSTGITPRNELSYHYVYDQRHRMSIKKVPGTGEAWMVYDARDRLVMTQDSLLRAQGKWMVTEYDSLNRPWRTGLLTDANNQSYHQGLAWNSISYPSTSSGYEVLTQTYYDDYSWASAVGMTPTMATNVTGNSNYFYTTYNSSPTYAVNPMPLYTTRGLATGTKKEVLGSNGSQYLYAVSFYDDHNRTIQSQSTNYTGAVDTATTQYDFIGRPLRSLIGHRKNGNTVQNHTILTKMDYDQASRLKHIWKNIDNSASDQLIDSMLYDELGQLRVKYIGNNIDSLVYDYNIRGWLTGINKSYVAGTANHYFGMELGYDKNTSSAPGNAYTSPTLNGNIGGTVWKTTGSGVNRKYDFAYDNANRLQAANFTQYNGSGFDQSAGINFTTNNLSYDANGNILTMNQYGFVVGGGASNLIDQLAYSYQANSNKLSGVTDAANNATSRLGDFHYDPTKKQATDYGYDGNGNLLTDNNKAIDNIGYNYLNLPQLVHMNTKGNITYTYDAAGGKIKKVATDSTSRHSTTTLYLGGFVYQQTDTITNPGGNIDTLQFIAHEEGRARWAYHKYTTGVTAYKFEYDFFEKDHLGNTRMVLTQERDTSNYLASMEAAYRNTESQLFANVATTSYTRASVPGYPVNTQITNPNDSVSKVDYNGTSGQTSGPSLLLKVMSGDTVTVGVQSYYNTNTVTSTNSSFANVLSSLAAGLLNTATGGAEGTLATITATTSPVYSGLNSFLTTMDTGRTGSIKYPKAYLNWVFLDDQFNYVNTSSGAVPAASSFKPAGTLNTIAPGGPLTMPKNGYLYVWVSNETQGWDVFFDNLSVQYKQGPILEENHYYPFGLMMAGISEKAVKTQYSENKYRYNGGDELQNKEFSDGSGLEMYDAVHRMYDPQIGRFGQIDPMTDLTLDQSPYGFAVNNPVLLNDPLGLDTGTNQLNLPPVEVHAKSKSLDTENGQVYPATSGIWDLLQGHRVFVGHWQLGGKTYATRYEVDSRGYLTGKTAVNELVFDAPVDKAPLNFKAVFKLKNFIKSQYVVYKYTKNGLPYIGKALGSLAARYGSEEKAVQLGAEVFEGLSKIPNNAVALGVEQLVIDLNGGVGTGALSNINNATIKQIYVNEARYWLDSNLPNWEHVLKFQ